MPATSKSQFKFMAMCSNPKSRKRAWGKCPPVSVAKEFVSASKGKVGKLPEKAKKRSFSAR